MYAQVLGSTTFGLNGHVIGVEVDINKNFPSFDIVGLPTTAVKESKERVHSAIRNSGYHFPVDKVTVNLAPADLKKRWLRTGSSDRCRPFGCERRCRKRST